MTNHCQFNMNSKSALLLGAAALCLPAAAMAQGTGSSTPNETIATEVDGERIIIVQAARYVPSTEGETATKSNIPLIETPQSVTVVTRDQIDLLNFIDAQQAVRYVAGVSGENYGPDLRFDFIQVRGFTPKQFIDGLATPVTTTIFSNGVDLYAFDTLDILKGPASVLYGSSPPGGLYNQRSRRASSEFGGEIGVKYGEVDYKQIAATITGPASDWLDARATVLYRDRGADRDFVNASRLLFAPTFTAHLGPDTDFTALLYYQWDEVEGDTNGFLPAQGTLLPNPNGPISRGTNLGEPDFNRYTRRQYGAGFEFSHDFSEMFGMDINLKYSDYSEFQQVIYGASLGDDNRTVGRFNFPYDEEVESFAVDGRLWADVATGSLNHNLLFGVDYRTVDNVALFGFAGATDIDLYNPVYGVGGPFSSPGLDFSFNNQKVDQTGIYAQDQIAIGNFRLLLSGRYDWVDTLNRTSSAEGDQSEFTYRVGLSYISDSGVAPYVSYATSFEPQIGTDVNGDAYDPATGMQIEGGIKFDGRAMGDDIKLFATAAGFYIEQENLVVTAVSPTGPPIGATQTGKVEVYGGEIEVVARIRDQLSINGTYSYTHSEITASNTPAEIGAELPVTPKHKASLFVNYQFQRGGLGGLGVGAGVRYASKSAGSINGLFSDDPVLFDALLSYDTPGWRFAVNGSNIFDKRYVARCAAINNCNFGAGRQVIGSVTKKF